MKTTAVKGNPGIRMKASGKFIVTKSMGGQRTTKEFTSLSDARVWKKDKSTIELKVNGKDPSLSGQGAGRNEIFFRDVYAQYLEEGMIELDYNTILRKKRRMDRFFQVFNPIKISELNSRVVLKLIQDSKLLVEEGSRRCNFDKEIKDLSSVLNWYNEEITPFLNPIRRKHYQAGFIKDVEKKNRNLPPEALPVAGLHMRKKIRYLVVMQFLLGARVGEACALNDRTVDFRNNQIDLSEVIQWRDSVPFHKKTNKTKTSNVKEMTPLMREILLELKNERPKGCKFFFENKGKPLAYNLILRELNKALEISGYGEFSGTHVLRYSMSTFARKNGSLDIAQAMLSHADARMTEGYAKLDVNKKVTGVVIEAEKFFRPVQPSCNQTQPSEKVM